jgi:predicted nucleic acid-binding protein
MSEGYRKASRLYLDSNALIYFVERADARQAKIGEALAWAVTAGAPIVISEVGVAECLYGAYKMRNAALEARYLEIFDDIALFEIAPLDGARLRAAAKLGAQQGLKLVDAAHFLAAMEYQCEAFITNDARFRSSHGVEVFQVQHL